MALLQFPEQLLSWKLLRLLLCLFTSKERGLGLAILPHFLVVLALRKILPPLLTVSEGDGRPACPSEHGLLRTC